MGVVAEGPLHVAAHEEVEPAVVVEVHEGGARGPAAARDPGLGGHVGEAAVALVPVELVGEDAGHVQVLVAVVVVVADRDPLPVARAGQARGRGHVLETAVRLLAVEPVPVARPVLDRQGALRHRVVDARPVREEDVEAPVAVVVEERHPRAHRLRQVLLRGGRGHVPEVDATRHSRPRSGREIWPAVVARRQERGEKSPEEGPHEGPDEGRRRKPRWKADRAPVSHRSGRPRFTGRPSARHRAPGR